MISFSDFTLRKRKRRRRRENEIFSPPVPKFGKRLEAFNLRLKSLDLACMEIFHEGSLADDEDGFMREDCSKTGASFFRF